MNEVLFVALLLGLLSVPFCAGRDLGRYEGEHCIYALDSMHTAADSMKLAYDRSDCRRFYEAGKVVK